MQLNEAQKQAVEYVDGPLMIIAGAGTGKTTVLTERVKKIISDGLAKPSEILALTFTEKAAREMEERIDVALPMGYVQTWIMTFHSFGEQILRSEGLSIGLDSGFNMLSEAESQLFLKKHFGEFDLTYFKPRGNPNKFIRGLVKHFSRLKDEDITPKQYIDWVKQQTPSEETSKEEIAKFEELAKAYEKYEQLKHQEGVMDFGDLITNTLRLFRERPDVLKKYQERFKYILVDEYQDTNYAQTEIVHLLASTHRKIAVFLDDDQSIYRFRGAAVYNAMAFREQFPETKVVVLTENYRSTQPILDHSYQLVTNNNPDRLEIKEHVAKKLTAARGTGETPRVMFLERGEDEADAVAEEINQLIQRSDDYQWKDAAILVRANGHADIFTKALSRFGIPYQFLGPGKLYNQPEIKDLIAYYRVLANFSDDAALYRLITKEFFHINRRDIAALLAWADERTVSLFETLEQIADTDIRIADESKKQLSWLRDILLRHLDLVPKYSPGQLLYYFLEDTRLLELYQTVTTDREQREVQNISKFFDQLRAFELKQPDATVHDWVEYVEFVWDQGESPIASEIDWSTQNAVNILTVHSAKGLEFPIVFLVNLVNDRFPTRHRHDQIPIPDALAKEPLPEKDVHAQEERRLFYVAMTRAKELLYLSGAKFYGDAKKPKKLSPFVHEALGEDLSEFLYEAETKEKTIPLFDWVDVQRDTPTTDEMPEAHKVTYLSFSQIDAFRICPMHYKMRYILNVPTPPNAALTFGTTMHNTMRAFYQWTTSAQFKTQNAKLQNKILELYDQYWIPMGFESKDQRNRMYTQGKTWLQDYVKKSFDPNETVIDLEKSFSIKIAPDLRLGGRIDRVSRLPDGRLEIIDYKTGAPRTQKDLDKDLQLAIYALAATDPDVYNQPIEQVSLAFYYFESGEKVCVDLSAPQLQLAKQEVVTTREAIEHSNFACSNNFICQQGCEYDLFCNRGE